MISLNKSWILIYSSPYKIYSISFEMTPILDILFLSWGWSIRYFLTMSTAFLVFFAIFESAIAISKLYLSRWAAFSSFLNFGFLYLLKRIRPPWTETKLSIPEGFPCYTLSKSTDIAFMSSFVSLSRPLLTDTMSDLNATSRVVARTVLKAAEEPRHLPNGIVDFT